MTEGVGPKTDFEERLGAAFAEETEDRSGNVHPLGKTV